MSKREHFISWISKDVPILADGAMGTMLHADGVPLNSCIDQLNLTDPERILGIHQSYLEAGAQILETNTFGANRYKLAQYGLEDHVSEINKAGVEIAREAANSTSHEVLIAGSVGPLGVSLAPYGRIKTDSAFCAYEDQISALVEAGVDLILIETQTDLREALQAVHAARSVPDLPLIATMTFTRDDRTLLGDTPADVAKKLFEAGTDVIGVNCSTGPAQILRILQQMRESVPEAYFSVMPNAGWPEQVNGRIIYADNPQYFADYALAYKDAGAIIIGGCCGTTPAHITAARNKLYQSRTDRTLEQPVSITTFENLNPPSTYEPTQLASKLKEGKFVITVEVNPPRGFSTHKLLTSAQMLSEAGADTINLTDSPMARMRMSPWAACQLIQNKIGIETILHFPTRGRNLLRIQGDLLAAHALGVRNIFVVMGDPTAIGDYPEAMDNYDIVPSGLIRLIHQGFNAGIDHIGSDIGEATSFFIGCALNLAAKDLQRETQVLKRKIDSGAHFALTQPLFELEKLHQFRAEYFKRFGELNIPILIGVLPLHSYRHASFLHHEVPGINIPDAIIQRIASSEDDVPEEGKRIAVELIQRLKAEVAGIYIMPAFGRYDIAAEIIEIIRDRTSILEPC